MIIKNMKTVVYIILFIFFGGCYQSDIVEPGNKNDNLSKINSIYMDNVYSTIGPLHNEGLDFVIPKLVSMKGQLAPKSKEETVKYIFEQVDVFWEKYETVNKSQNIIDIENDKMFNICLNIANNTDVQAVQYAENLSDSILDKATKVIVDDLNKGKTKNAKFLSYNVSNYIKQLKTMVKSYYTFYPSYYNVLNSGTNLYSEEPDFSNLLLYSSVSVSQHSSLYWENFKLNELNKTSNIAGIWGVVGAIDLAAAVVAAVFYIWDSINGAEYSMWGYIKAVTKAAIAASATAAIGRLWGKW